MGRKNAIFLCLAVAALVTLGLVVLTSTSDGQLLKQAVITALGLLVALAISNIDYRRFRALWIPALIGVCILLALCYVPGIGLSMNGASRWIQMQGLPFRFQPSELAKICIVMALAAWYAHYQAEGRQFLKGFFWPSLILSIPVLLILFEQDIGTAMAIGCAGVLVMYTAGVRLPYLVFSGSAALAAIAPVVWLTRRDRIEAWLDPEKHRSDNAYQQYLATRSFKNGGLDGQGLAKGVESKGLPESHNDFIFAVIGEELGIWFTLGTVFCYVVIMVCGIAIAMQAKDVFGRLLAVGLTSVIVVPAVVNMGVCTRLLPNTGLPLPFISYGGTNMLFTLLAIGLLVSIHRQTADAGGSQVAAIQQKKQCLRI